MLNRKGQKGAQLNWQRVCLLMCLWLGWLFMMQSAQANTREALALTAQQADYDVLSVAQYLQDPRDSLTVADFESGVALQDWRPLSAHPGGFGLTPSTYWFRVDLLHYDTLQTNYIFQITNPQLERVTFYLVYRGDVIDEWQTGKALPFAQRAYELANLTYKPAFTNGLFFTLYIKVQSENSLIVPMKLQQEKQFYADNQTHLLVTGLYFGILIVAVLVNLIFFAFNHRPIYVWFAFFSAAFCAFQFSYMGLGYQYIWPNSVGFEQSAVLLFMLASIISTLGFAYHFFQIKLSPKQLKFWGGLLVVSLIGFVALYEVLDFVTAILMGWGIMAVNAFALLLVAYWVWLKGKVEGLVFLLSWSTLLLVMLLIFAEHSGLLALDFNGNGLMQLAVLVQILVFSLALAKHLRNETKQRMSLQNQLAEDLTEQVHQRTLELEAANARLQALSYRDSLSGLYNRRYFEQELEKQFMACLRQNQPLSVVMLDIDFFKRINDRFGHLEGDNCISLVAQIIRSAVMRPLDSACRYGGEEFLLILPDTDSKGAALIGEKIRLIVEQTPMHFAGEQVPITISVGCATRQPSQQLNVQDLIKLADDALYIAKSKGRNQVVSA